jgi:hypothetical protein
VAIRTKGRGVVAVGAVDPGAYTAGTGCVVVRGFLPSTAIEQAVPALISSICRPFFTARLSGGGDRPAEVGAARCLIAKPESKPDVTQSMSFMVRSCRSANLACSQDIEYMRRHGECLRSC